jgi:hypothetical protein
MLVNDEVCYGSPPRYSLSVTFKSAGAFRVTINEPKLVVLLLLTLLYITFKFLI